MSAYTDVSEGRAGTALTVLAGKGGLNPCDEPTGLRLCPAREVTRAEALLALVVARGWQPQERADGSEAAPKFKFTDDFEKLELWDRRTPSYRNRVTLTGRGYDGNGLHVTIPRGSHFGADFRLDLSDKVDDDPEHLYFRYYLRLDPDWASSSSGKLPGFSGIYHGTGKGGFPSSPGSPGWSARVKFATSDASNGLAPLGYYVYHLGQEGRYGDGMTWNDAGRSEREAIGQLIPA